MRKIPVLAVCTFVLLAAIGHSRARAAEGEQLNFVTTGELKSMMDKGEKFVLINALSPLEYTQTKIEGAVNIPFGKLKKGESILPEDKKSKLIFYCMGPK